MMKKVLLIIYLLIEVYLLKFWLICTNLGDSFHYSAFDLQLRLIDAIHNDKGVTIILVRIFHNKVLGVALDIYQRVLLYWDIMFFLSLLGLVGLVGLLLGIRYLWQQKTKRLWLLGCLVLLLCIQVIETLFNLHVPFLVKLLALWIPYQFVCLSGYSQFFSRPTWVRSGVFLLLIGISIWWIMVMQADIYSYCRL